MKPLIAISILGILLVGCTEPTIENGCRGDVIEDNNKCLRVVNERLRHKSDSLNYELKLLQQKFHDSLNYELKLMQHKFQYECADRKASL